MLILIAQAGQATAGASDDVWLTLLALYVLAVSALALLITLFYNLPRARDASIRLYRATTEPTVPQRVWVRYRLEFSYAMLVFVAMLFVGGVSLLFVEVEYWRRLLVRSAFAAAITATLIMVVSEARSWYQSEGARRRARLQEVYDVANENRERLKRIEQHAVEREPGEPAPGKLGGKPRYSERTNVNDEAGKTDDTAREADKGD